MNIETEQELKKTDVWTLYEQAIAHMRKFNMFTDSDKNYRMYNGNQWEGLIVEGIEPVQLNFIKPIVNYKVGVLTQNLWSIVYSSENYEEKEFKPVADELCKMLNKKASQIWERTKMDRIIRKVSLDSAVNDEGVIYTYFDNKEKLIYNQLLNKTDIFYGNENSSDIQSQPYILIKKRMPVYTCREMAQKMGVASSKIELIRADSNTTEETGENKTYEVNDMVTVVTKMWKKDGKVHFQKATQFVDLQDDTSSGLTRYPISHMLWTDQKGYSRGEGVVRNLIPNQLEVNKTLMRRALVAKNTAYPQKVVKIDDIVNPSEIDAVGGIIKVTGQTEDVRSVFTTTNPAQMSPDVKLLQEDLIETTRMLENAGDITTGAVNPENASGKAILAVQNASQQSLTEQVSRLKDLVEDLALIWLDIITTYTGKQIVLQAEQENPMTGEKVIIPVAVPKSALKSLKSSVKIDITPMSVYDQYARELSLENLLKQGFFSPQAIDQLELYATALPDNSTMPKQDILDIIKRERAKQNYINQLDAQAKQMFSASQQYLQSDPSTQADINNAMNQQQMMAQMQ